MCWHPDQLGFGESDRRFIVDGIQTWVDSLGDFLRKKRLGPLTLMGESPGNWIAARYTLQALRDEAVGHSFVLPEPSKLLARNLAGSRETQLKSDEQPFGCPGLGVAGEKDLLARIFHSQAFNTEASIRVGLKWKLTKETSHTIAAVLGTRRRPARRWMAQLNGRIASIDTTSDSPRRSLSKSEAEHREGPILGLGLGRGGGAGRVALHIVPLATCRTASHRYHLPRQAEGHRAGCHGARQPD